ncbi:C4-dicarboxylate ABC transporter permease [Halomonas sp. 1513]|nr:TRAP transporter large permease subunit [Halomonas sp. 1513]APX92962.1 C4-dicarboxylate ABC transporter permease [Halomonas sp. 1513]
MDSTLLALCLVLVGLLTMLASGVWVAISLLGIGISALAVFSNVPLGDLVISKLWESSWSWPMTALPLFIWMGEILFRTKLSGLMFNGLSPWVGWLPGRLLHVNVLGCGIMAAVAGSSAVTAATVGRMSMSELKDRHYDDRLMIGTLAGSATLGLLIPPSVVLIVYGVVAQQSVARLFMAGILPGIMLITLFMAYIAVWALLNPGKMPPPEQRMTLKQRLLASVGLLPILLLIATVIGSIYAGIATPTESATFGVLGALAIAHFSGSLTVKVFLDSLLGATRIACMIGFIVAAAAVLSSAFSFIGIPQYLAQLVNSLELSPYMLLLVLTLFFIVLGCFLEGISILVISSAVVLPMLQAAGIDLLWFGIYVVVIIELAQITPPIGFNLFVLQSITGRDIWQVTMAAAPFFVILCFAALLLVLFPGIATWLPSLM